MMDHERQHFAALIDHLDHILPGQAPLRHFVHHNTLHGFQHLPFEEALASAWHRTGKYPYWSDDTFRLMYRKGRIDDSGLRQTLAQQRPDDETSVVLTLDGRDISRNDIHHICMIAGIRTMSATELDWHLAEPQALQQFAPTVGSAARKQIVDDARFEEHGKRLHPLEALWQQWSRSLPLKETQVGPDDTDLRQEVSSILEALINSIGDNLTLSRLLQRITGVDVTEKSRQDLFAASAAYLDEGYAPWRMPDRKLGFFAACRESQWCPIDEDEDALGAIIREMQAREIRRVDWEPYLESLAMEYPGWAGMFNWRHHHKDYPVNVEAPASLTDYLAIRLMLDRKNMDQLTLQLWGIQAGLAKIRQYFTRHYHEFFVRYHYYSHALPESLANQCAELIQLTHHHQPRMDGDWKVLAEEIFQWRRKDRTTQPRQCDEIWRLFILSQHLGLSHHAVAQLDSQQIHALLDATHGISQENRSFLWLCAYERQYREKLFNALTCNPYRHESLEKDIRPSMQAIFCMDEREESIRRHIEELDPSVQTWGVAGFFGIAMRYAAMGEDHEDDLCPVVVKPAHHVREVMMQEDIHAMKRYLEGLETGRVANACLYALPTRGVFLPVLSTLLLAPIALLDSFAQIIFASRRVEVLTRLTQRLFPKPSSRLLVYDQEEIDPEYPDTQRKVSNLQEGFTLQEQAARCAATLRTIGLIHGFAPWVMILGHGSSSRNNPHEAAYHCGACSGRPGGANARAFATMANHPEVREILRHQFNICIPEDTRFVGGEHDTSTDDIRYYDTATFRGEIRSEWQAKEALVKKASARSALERCRRFATATAKTTEEALQHVAKRAASIHQPRPELGHAGNASAVIGRRSITRGIFLDRRSFLLSYDCTQDPEGHVLEALLLAATPVGAGINLEYYFSTMNNQAFGCGSKVPHNLTGWFGIMEGSSSDLRTGLPQQMVEVHEPMRLLVIVEHYPEIIARIYQKQPSLQELIGGMWVTLAVLHPEKDTLYEFSPALGFQEWLNPFAGMPIPNATSSLAWCSKHDGLLPPALIHAETISETN